MAQVFLKLVCESLIAQRIETLSLIFYEASFRLLNISSVSIFDKGCRQDTAHKNNSKHAEIKTMIQSQATMAYNPGTSH